MKEVIKRWNSPTPKFWKKIQRNGAAIAIIGGIIIKFSPIVGGIVTTIGTTMSALAQLTIED